MAEFLLKTMVSSVSENYCTIDWYERPDRTQTHCSGHTARTDENIKARTHCPCLRAVNTERKQGVSTAREHGREHGRHFWEPVSTGHRYC